MIFLLEKMSLFENFNLCFLRLLSKKFYHKALSSTSQKASNLFFVCFVFRFYLFLLERCSYRERRDKDLAPAGSLPNQLQQLELGLFLVRSQVLLPNLPRGTESQGLEPSSAGFPGQKKGSGLEFKRWDINWCPHVTPEYEQMRLSSHTAAPARICLSLSVN